MLIKGPRKWNRVPTEEIVKEVQLVIAQVYRICVIFHICSELLRVLMAYCDMPDKANTYRSLW